MYNKISTKKKKLSTTLRIISFILIMCFIAKINRSVSTLFTLTVRTNAG